MPVLDATWMAQINVLLGIMSGEDAMVWLAEMHGARHARVAIRDIESAGIVNIPIQKMLGDV